MASFIARGIKYDKGVTHTDGNVYFAKASDGTLINSDTLLTKNWYSATRYITFKYTSGSITWHATSAGTGTTGPVNTNKTYYVSLYKPGASHPFCLSSSAKVSGAHLGWITANEFYLGCPAAKIYYNANGGTAKSGYSIDSNGYSNIVDSAKAANASDFNIYDVGTLFSRANYQPRANAYAWKNGATGNYINQTGHNFNSSEYVTYPTTRINLYAQWELNTSATYKITYNANGGTGAPSALTYTYHPTETVTLATGSSLSRSGYTFGGWATSSSAETAEYAAGGSFPRSKTSNTTLYAVWFKNATSKQYTLTFNPNGGIGGPGTQTVTQGKSYKIPEGTVSIDAWDNQPRKFGYTFKEWKCNGASYQCGTSITPTGNMTFVAQWSTATDITVYRSNLTDTNTVTKSYTVSPQFHGHAIYYVIKPDIDSTYTFEWSAYSLFNAYQFKIYDSTGTAISGWELSDNDKTTLTVDLTSGVVYYLGTRNSEGTNAVLKVSASVKKYTATIRPNGGSYYLGSSSTAQSSVRSQPFTARNSMVVLSTNSYTSGRNAFTDSGVYYQKYISLPSRTGYQFLGWDLNIDYPFYLYGISSQSMYALYNPHQNFSVNALWENNTYFIEYNGNGSTDGVMYESYCVYDETSTLSLNEFVRTTSITYDLQKGVCETTSGIINHDFANWNRLQNGSGVSYSDGQSVKNLTATDGDVITLYAQWKINSTILPTPRRLGYKFLGWFTSPDDGDFVGMGGDSYSTDVPNVTLYAHWDPLGLVRIKTDEGWKLAIPYVYNEDESKWKQSMGYVYDGQTWKFGI